jgi:hypothetical protein
VQVRIAFVQGLRYRTEESRTVITSLLQQGEAAAAIGPSRVTDLLVARSGK